MMDRDQHRIETGLYCSIKKVYETWYYMWFGVYVRNLHFLSCVHHITCILKTSIMERSDEEVDMPGLRCDPSSKTRFIVS